MYDIVSKFFQVSYSQQKTGSLKWQLFFIPTPSSSHCEWREWGVGGVVVNCINYENLKAYSVLCQCASGDGRTLDMYINC